MQRLLAFDRFKVLITMTTLQSNAALSVQGLPMLMLNFLMNMTRSQNIKIKYNVLWPGLCVSKTALVIYPLCTNKTVNEV